MIEKEKLLLAAETLSHEEIKRLYISMIMTWQSSVMLATKIDQENKKMKAEWQKVLTEARKYGDEDMFGVYPMKLFQVISEAMDVLGE